MSMDHIAPRQAEGEGRMRSTERKSWPALWADQRRRAMDVAARVGPRRLAVIRRAVDRLVAKGASYPEERAELDRLAAGVQRDRREAL